LSTNIKDGYGPFSPACDEIERGKQLRSLIALTHTLFGLRHPLIVELRAAESGDPTALERAHALIEALPPLHRRRLLVSFSAITWPPRSRSKAGGAP
jgi:hypothetical protein